jgi:hypothetical protein
MVSTDDRKSILLGGGHRVYMQVEWPPVAKEKHALLVPTFESVWRLSWKADVGRRLHLLAGAISSDVGERPFQPKIKLVAGVTMIWDDIFRRRSQKDFTAAFGQIASEHGDLDACRPGRTRREGAQYGELRHHDRALARAG